MIIFLFSLLAIDTRYFLHSLISEPVFSIPIVCAIFNIPITSNILFIILFFQLLSVFSLQLGKFVPPEYQTGAMVSFIIIHIGNTPFPYAIIGGILFSYLFSIVFNYKQKINLYFIKIKNLYLANILSLLISIFVYIVFFYFALFLKYYISQYVIYNNFLFIKILFIFSILLLIKEFIKIKINQKEIFLFLLGIVSFIIVKII